MDIYIDVYCLFLFITSWMLASYLGNRWLFSRAKRLRVLGLTMRLRVLGLMVRPRDGIT
jgi:hypothetical protein